MSTGTIDTKAQRAPLGITTRDKYLYEEDASQGSYGTMMCPHCGKAISSGEYRVHENRNGFVTFHRACCSDDPHWAERDAARIAELEAENQRLRAALELQKAAVLRWFYEEFDDEKLQEMEDAGIIAQAEGFSLTCVVQLKMDMDEALSEGDDK